MRTFFGDLPLELRIPIYRELLTSDKPVDAIKHRSRRDTHMRPRRKNNIHPAILRTCKRAYFEASKYLYEENRIRFDVIDYCGADKTLLWGDSYGLSKSNLAQIKHLEIAYRDARKVIIESWFKYPEYDEDLISLIIHLDSRKCPLESFRLTFYFYPLEHLVPSSCYTSEEKEVLGKLAWNAELREAVAAIRVKSTVEIVVDSGEEDDCKEMIPFVDAVRSLRQWALTLDQETVEFDYEGEVTNERDGEDDAEQRITEWAIAVQDQGDETENEEGDQLCEAINEDNPDGKEEEHHDKILRGKSDGVEDGSSSEIEPGVGTADKGGANSDSDSDDDDEQQDPSDHMRHIWTFTLRPATPSTEGQILTRPPKTP